MKEIDRLLFNLKREKKKLYLKFKNLTNLI